MAATPTSALAWDNFFQATLTGDITATSTDILMDAIPTAGQGFLVIDPDSTTSREIIFYDSKTALKVVCPSAADGRGQDGTTASAHSTGTTVIMATVAAMFEALQSGQSLAIESFGAYPFATGWVPSGLTVNSVTENGNRSADITFASTVANILTPGMRIRTSRTVAAPTYMGGAFNGTNHYFTKVTCTSTLSTVTDNFTIMAFVEPTAYAISAIASRSDAAPNNSMSLLMEATGQVTVIVRNAAGANFRSITSYQSLPLNKKTHVAASWASGTVIIYFDGVSVPVAAAGTGGTAPTTAGTGGDFSIGREGAFNSRYFTGYISGVGVFNAVLSASTIKSYKNQVLSGSETNCIGAWSLNNTGVNQQAAGTNDLTATNSVSYTLRSPYTTDANGTASGTYDWAIVTKVATTVATVQYPEGNAIATSGGISAVAYSTQKAPYGMPVALGRWAIIAKYRSQTNVTNTTIAQYAGRQITSPVGDYKLSISSGFVVVPNAIGGTGQFGLSTTTTTYTETDLATSMSAPVASQASTYTFTRSKHISNNAQTIYYLNNHTNNAATTMHDQSTTFDNDITLEPAYL